MAKLFRSESVRKIAEEKKTWLQDCYGKQKELKPSFKTLSGLPMKALYTPEDCASIDYLRDLGFPGLEPFIRGVYPTMYRGRTWTQRQLAGYGPPEETNKRYKFLLEQGATGINGVFDYPTLRGYDSTDPFARADAGQGGVAIDTIEDMRILFQGIPIEQVSTSLVTCQPICNISIQSMYFANAMNRDIPLHALSGTSQNDFLMETAITIAPGVLPPEYSFKLSCDAIEFCAKNAPRWNPVSFAGYNYRESGCTAIQEVALVMANAIACTEELLRRGLPLERFASRLSFFFSSHSDFFEEVAKYRAARRIWARLMKERFKAKDPRSMMLRFHAQTAGSTLTAQQPDNTVVRVAYQAMAAVLGGTQSLHTNSMDETLALPTELAVKVALRTQQLIAWESGVANTIDPLAGSWFVEDLTNRMEAEANAIFARIEELGGVVPALEQGWFQREIGKAAYRYQRELETGRQVIVGVNKFVEPEESDHKLEVLRIDERTERDCVAGLAALRRERSQARVDAALARIRADAGASVNLMPAFMQGAESLCTLGEMVDVLRGVFGTYREPAVF